jgi:uncharacterized protein YjeT (DUF2065 family)
MTNSIIAVVSALVVVFALSYLDYRRLSKQLKSSARDLGHYRRNILRKSGCTSLLAGVSNYTIESFDGGRNWYAVKDTSLETVREKDGSYRREFTLEILGKAEDIYPGLVEHLAAMDRLAHYATSYGPLSLASGVNGPEAEMLRDIGLTVREAA